MADFVIPLLMFLLSAMPQVVRPADPEQLCEIDDCPAVFMQLPKPFLTGLFLASRISPDGNPANTEGVVGEVVFAELESDLTEVNYNISGLEGNRLHALHVHEHANFSHGCISTGGHYNPFNRDHGAPQFYHRHIGDLGNIRADPRGNAVGRLQAGAPLVRRLTICHRAVVVHEGSDDLGLGGDDESRTTGNSGAPKACGRIVWLRS